MIAQSTEVPPVESALSALMLGSEDNKLALGSSLGALVVRTLGACPGGDAGLLKATLSTVGNMCFADGSVPPTEPVEADRRFADESIPPTECLPDGHPHQRILALASQHVLRRRVSTTNGTGARRSVHRRRVSSASGTGFCRSKCLAGG